MTAAPVPVPTERWPGLLVVEAVSDGARSSVWRGELAGRAVAIRRTKRSIPSLEWELQLLIDLDRAGFRVPVPMPAVDGALHVDGWNVVTWLDGREPSTEDDWRLVAAELRRIHRRFRRYGQRPGTASVLDLSVARRSVDADLDRTPLEVIERCLPHFDPYLEAHRSVIHGDVHAGNVRLTDSGRVGLLDWDETRVDICDLDLSNLGTAVLSGRRQAAAEAAAHAWEALNGWVVEPAYAQSRLDQLPDAVVSTAEMVLNDGRILLRPPSLEDAAAQLDGEDHEIQRWLTGGTAAIERVRNHISNLRRCWGADGLLRHFGIYPTAADAETSQPLVGNLDINLADLDLELNEANLSYAVFAPWRGRGYAAMAVTLGVEYLHRIDPELTPTLKIDTANAASVGVARAAGFVRARTIESERGRLSIWQQP